MLRLVKFGCVGASGAVVNLACTHFGYLVLFASVAEPARSSEALLLGIVVSILSNFLLNEAWTWRDRSWDRALRRRRFTRFSVVSVAAAGVQFGVAMLLVFGMGHERVSAQIVAIGVSSLLNFALNHVWTFPVAGEYAEVAHPVGRRRCAS